LRELPLLGNVPGDPLHPATSPDFPERLSCPPLDGDVCGAGRHACSDWPGPAARCQRPPRAACSAVPAPCSAVPAAWAGGRRLRRVGCALVRLDGSTDPAADRAAPRRRLPSRTASRRVVRATRRTPWHHGRRHDRVAMAFAAPPWRRAPRLVGQLCALALRLVLRSVPPSVGAVIGLRPTPSGPAAPTTPSGPALRREPPGLPVSRRDHPSWSPPWPSAAPPSC